jgi:hypothetical protein
VDLTINLVERKTGGLGAGTGISAQGRGEGALPGFVGSFTYSQRNLFGLGQRLSALVELGQTDKVRSCPGGWGHAPARGGAGGRPCLRQQRRACAGLPLPRASALRVWRRAQVFRLQHVDPWISGDPYRTSRTIQVGLGVGAGRWWWWWWWWRWWWWWWW